MHDGERLITAGSSIVQDSSVTKAPIEKAYRNIFVITMNKKFNESPKLKWITDYKKDGWNYYFESTVSKGRRWILYVLAGILCRTGDKPLGDKSCKT